MCTALPSLVQLSSIHTFSLCLALQRTGYKASRRTWLWVVLQVLDILGMDPANGAVHQHSPLLMCTKGATF